VREAGIENSVKSFWCVRCITSSVLWT